MFISNCNRAALRKVVLSALPALFMMGSAFAAVAAEVPATATVRFQDLDLSSTQDIARLYKRIRAAAVEVCRSAEGPQLMSGIHSTAWNQCFYHAIGNAVHTVHNDKLSAYHWQRIRGWDHQQADVAAVASR